MKPYRFRLEALAALRAREEERARSAFQQALQNERRILAQIEEVEARRAAEAAACLGTAGQSVAAAARVRQWDSLCALERDRAAEMQKLAGTRRIREQKMSSLVDARRRVRMLETLRQRQKEAHDLAMLREEERELADAVWARQQSRGSAGGAP